MNFSEVKQTFCVTDWN